MLLRHITRSWRSNATVLALACAALPFAQRQASGQSSRSAPASIDAEAKTVADSMWRTILTTCPVQIRGQSITATFYGSPKGDLDEFRDTWTKLFSEPRTDADKLNGIEFKGLAVLGFSAYRTMERGVRRAGQRRWSEFLNGSRKSSEVKSESDLGDAWNSGKYIWMPVGIEKRNGQWSFKFHWWGPSREGGFHLDSLSQAADKKSCAALTSADPFAADDALARKQEDERLALERKQEEEKWAKASKLASLENDLKVSRDLGNALLCEGTKPRVSLMFDDSSRSPTSRTSIPVKIVGATDKGGVLGEWLRVQLLGNGRSYGLTEEYYFVPTSAVRDSCGLPNTQGLVSGSALADGLRAAGSLDRWPAWHKQAEEAKTAELNAAALTAKEFTGKLADAVHKRGPELGEDPSEYEAAIQWAGNLVFLCSSISPSEFAASMDKDGFPRLRQYQLGKYQACIQTITGWKATPTSGFVYRITSSDLRLRWRREQRNWVGPKLHVDVSLCPIDGNSFDKRYTILSADIKNEADASALASDPQTTSSLARPTSVRNNRQIVRVCINANIYASAPVGTAAQGSGRLLGTAEPGDEGVVLQKRERASRVEFEIPGQKIIGWLPNSAFCAGQ